MAENKIVKVPVASHGLHRHPYNYPWLSSINFGDVMPCYINTLRKGERDQPKAGLFSQLMPIAHNAFATGRYNFKGIFVPYKLVWRPWYAFDQQTNYFGSTGTPIRISSYPFVTHSSLTSALVANYTSPGNVDDFDFCVYVNATTNNYYHLTDAGRRIVRILGALGSMPSFVDKDPKKMNILPILCYLKAFGDYYFPNNYVDGSAYNLIARFYNRETIDFTSEAANLLAAIEVCSLNFYENCVFDLAWDNPVAPNVAPGTPSVAIKDVSNDAQYPSIVANDPTSVVTPTYSDVMPANGTPFVGGTKASTGNTSSPFGVITKYVIDSLNALSLWMKRRQLSGARLLDRFLVSRGISLPNDSAMISYYLGQRNVEIQVSGVENNTDDNLGELAGRGVASSGDSPLSFECRPDDDGIFLVIVSPIPDANFPVLLDGFANRESFMENYHAEYDKLGAAAVSSRLIQTTMRGDINQYVNANDPVHGFLSQYWDEIQERPRLLGDFILPSRGSEELSAYHTFRLLSVNAARHHSYDFVRMADNAQYQRLFYSDKQENLMLFLRWYGEQYKEKLPLGDSYNWDDDELNRKVAVVIGGSQK